MPSLHDEEPNARLADVTAPQLRYRVVDGSQSAHCCFDATVVDTTKPVMIGGEHYNGQFEPICECFDVEDATHIAAAMNLAAKLVAESTIRTTDPQARQPYLNVPDRHPLSVRPDEIGKVAGVTAVYLDGQAVDPPTDPAPNMHTILHRRRMADGPAERTGATYHVEDERAPGKMAAHPRKREAES